MVPIMLTSNGTSKGEIMEFWQIEEIKIKGRYSEIYFRGSKKYTSCKTGYVSDLIDNNDLYERVLNYGLRGLFVDRDLTSVKTREEVLKDEIHKLTEDIVAKFNHKAVPVIAKYGDYKIVIYHRRLKDDTEFKSYIEKKKSTFRCKGIQSDIKIEYR